jgi:OOP family OmpA-OmpF porin
MRCNWRRWLWGLIPLIALSSAAIHLVRDAIEQDLADRARRVLSESGARWAAIAVDGRDVVLRGSATLDNEPVEAATALRRVWGVRHVNNNAGLAAKIEPFIWSARKRGNRVRLSGYVPNRKTRQVVIGIARAAMPGSEVVDLMHVGRGVPPTDTWIAGLSFALKQLASLKKGEVRLEDLAFAISGEAEDAAAYRALSATLKRGLPKGITLANARIAAPVVSPYTWSAQFAGGQLVLSGHVPGDSVRAELLAAAGSAPAGTDIVDRMEPAEGAPADWPNVAAALVKELVRLESGSIALKDAALTVGGIAADEAQAQAVRAALRAAATAPFKLTDQIRVREPKVEPKPAPDPAPPAPSPPTDARPAAPPEEASKLAAPAPAVPPPDPTSRTEAPKAEAAPKAEVAPKTEPAPKTEAKSEAAPKTEAKAEAAPKAAEGAPKTEDKMAAAPPPAVAPPPPALVAECRANLSKIARAGRILFDSDSATLDISSFDTLNRLAAAARQCPGVRIAVEGHADIEGSNEYNQRLSVRRAEAVVAYLVKAGADAQQLEAMGFGASRPAAPNTTVGNKAKNRRIEIIVRP